jgi:hypothetical protein
MNLRPCKAIVLGAAVLVGVAALGERRVAASRRAATWASRLSESVARGDLVLHVPHAPGPITLDSDTDDPGWLGLPPPAKIPTFLFDSGKPGHPHSEARLVWSGDYLYLSLYAADQDIEAHTLEPDQPMPLEDDFFHIVFSQGDVQYALDVSPKPMITDALRRGDGAWDRSWNSGAHVSREIDGSLNDPRGLDEEWAIELAVPLEALGMRGERGENIGLMLRRCDIPKREPRVCSSWGRGASDAVTGRIVLDGAR